MAEARVEIDELKSMYQNQRSPYPTIFFSSRSNSTRSFPEMIDGVVSPVLSFPQTSSIPEIILDASDVESETSPSSPVSSLVEKEKRMSGLTLFMSYIESFEEID